MATSQPQLSLAGNKRSADDFERDEEHDATASEPKRPCIRRMGEVTGRPMQSASHQAQSQIQRTVTRAPQSLDDFPPSEKPLPPNISLYKLCWSFPNHLSGENLKRFINANWSGRDMYLQMRTAAQSGLAVEKPWEVLQARLDKIKEEMPEDQGLNTEAANWIPESSQHLNDFSEEFEDEEVEEDEGGTEETLQPEHRLSLPELFNLVQGEVRKQRGVVHDTLRSLTLLEAEQCWQVIWNCRAQEWENAFMAIEKVNEDGIPLAKSTMSERTIRQLALLKKMVQRNHQPPTETNSEEQSLYNDTLTQYALEKQLDILKGWTEDFKKQQLAPENHRGERNEAMPKDKSSKSVLNSEASARNRGGSSERAHGLHATTPDHEYESFGDKTLEPVPHLNQTRVHGEDDGSGSLRDLNKRIDQNRHASSNSGRAQSLQKDDTVYRVQKAAPSQQHTWESHHHSSHMSNGGVPRGNDIWVSSNAFGQPGALPTLAALSAGHGQNPVHGGHAPVSTQPHSSTSISISQLPVNAFLQQPTVQDGSAPPAIKKRGAPRKIFFTRAPPADTPLPASVTDDQILRHYPEHLQKTEVMRRFVANSETRQGGYPTRDMVLVLKNHRIAGDEDTSLTDEQRLKKIRNWVVKERDSCNKELKSARDSNSQRPSAAATSTPAQASLQAPAMTITTSVSPPSVQTPSSMLTTYVPRQVGLQAQRNIVASPNHTALTYVPSSLNVGSLLNPFDTTQNSDLVPPTPHPMPSYPSMGNDDGQELPQSLQDPDFGQYTTAELRQETAAPGLKMDSLATHEAARQGETQWGLSARDEQNEIDFAWNQFNSYYPIGSNLASLDPASNAEVTQNTMSAGLPPLDISPLFSGTSFDYE